MRGRLEQATAPFKIFAVLFIILANLFAAPLCAQGADQFPRPQGAVNDFAGVLSQESRRSMEILSREVLSKTGVSIVVATMKDIGGADAAEYANRLYEAWGIGKKGEDKGVLIFLALKERRIRIETGYGVEGILPDGKVGEILDQYVVPFLRKGDYGKGLPNAVIAVSTVIASNAGVSLSENAPSSSPPERRKKRPLNLFSLIAFFIVLVLLLGTRSGRRMLPYILLAVMMGGGGRGGGGFGGFSGGFGGFGGGMSGGGGAGRGF